ncbi:hypothetical protein [Planctomicrobium piriforme]|uniref:Uncharacterized protein n=1 Tax=Planctomicrobium piriforme TaxID=1576369 RepID=A0A1I3FDK1_9PLAN|nr:hypothetical protein [Planctomicrobium piriforme]SFI09285.1 hypothetical protein SAMN05421753_105193 [Planctomicrobium piriforme]
MRSLVFPLAITLGFLINGFAAAQPVPLPSLGNRTPDDTVEGAIWEYKATAKKEGDTSGEMLEMSGKFRTEKSAIFDLGARGILPPKKDVDKAIEAAKKGELTEVKLPAPPQQKRIGDFQKVKGGRLKLNFTDPETLDGVMFIWPKKDTNDVWMGNYRQRKDGKFIQDWIVELRPIED